MNKMIAWMASNHVTANLLMLLILIGGIGALKGLKLEVFPETSTDRVSISVAYPGASPDEVERSVVVKIEDAIIGLTGVERVTSTASEGRAVVMVEAERDYDLQKLKDKLSSEIERIRSFPEEIETPEVVEVESSNPVLKIAITGDIAERELKELAESIKDELRAHKEITQVGISGTREYEIAIEVSEARLQEYGLTFQQVMAAIASQSIDLPGGKVRTRDGEILLRTSGLAKETSQFEEIVLRGGRSGETVVLKQVATVRNSFEDSDLRSYFNGATAVQVEVTRSGSQSALIVANAAKDYVKQKNMSLPEGVELMVWSDRSIILEQRIDLLIRNGRLGLFLVLIVLALFLDIRLAFWVSTGIGLSFLGAFWVLGTMGLSINMISLFAFIIVLGIVVDDAIVVGENVFTLREKGTDPLKASKLGAQRIAVPVVFAVLTTVATFSPLLNVEGMMGKIMFQVPIVVISVLLFSLLESLFILPSHLAGLRLHSSNAFLRASQGVSRSVDGWLGRMVDRFYIPLLKGVVKWPSLVIGLSLAVLILTVGLIRGGKIKTEFMPKAEADNIILSVTMPEGTSPDQTAVVLNQFAENARTLEKIYLDSLPELGDQLYEIVMVSVGEQPSKRSGPGGGASKGSDPTVGEVNLQFISADERGFSLEPIMSRWREMNATVEGVESMGYANSIFSAGADLNFKLTHADQAQLGLAIERVKAEMETFVGVKDITDDYEAGKGELQITLKPEAHTVGLSLQEIALQVRQAFYGGEAQRLQRGRDDIPVMVRYTEAERSSLETVHAMQIRTRSGQSVALSSVAEVTPGKGFSTIRRRDQSRFVTISADVEDDIANANDINKQMKMFIKGKLSKQMPGLKMVVGGMQEEQKKGMMSLAKGFLFAIFFVYLLLAVPFKSYVQPLVIMSAIPFGIVGAVIGHLLMGYNLSFMSMMGIVALAGVVVNDSLVFVDFVNEEREGGMALNEAIIEAGRSRFRPILLTTLTTFAGLMPMIFEKSFQAKMLIPMAISLGFGIIFATVITLVLVPAFVRMLDWTQRKARKFKREEAAGEVA